MKGAQAFQYSFIAVYHFGASARCPDENGERSLCHLREGNERRDQNNGLAVACLVSAVAARRSTTVFLRLHPWARGKQSARKQRSPKSASHVWLDQSGPTAPGAFPVHGRRSPVARGWLPLLAPAADDVVPPTIVCVRCAVFRLRNRSAALKSADRRRKQIHRPAPGR